MIINAGRGVAYAERGGGGASTDDWQRSPQPDQNKNQMGRPGRVHHARPGSAEQKEDQMDGRWSWQSPAVNRLFRFDPAIYGGWFRPDLDEVGPVWSGGEDLVEGFEADAALATDDSVECGLGDTELFGEGVFGDVALDGFGLDGLDDGVEVEHNKYLPQM